MIIRDTFRFKTGFGRILGLENTSVSSVFEKAKAQTPFGSYGNFVRKHNLSGTRKLLSLHCVSCGSRSKHSL